MCNPDWKIIQDYYYNNITCTYEIIENKEDTSRIIFK